MTRSTRTQRYEVSLRYWSRRPACSNKTTRGPRPRHKSRWRCAAAPAPPVPVPVPVPVPEPVPVRYRCRYRYRSYRESALHLTPPTARLLHRGPDAYACAPPKGPAMSAAVTALGVAPHAARHDSTRAVLRKLPPMPPRRRFIRACPRITTSTSRTCMPARSRHPRPSPPAMPSPHATDRSGNPSYGAVSSWPPPSWRRRARGRASCRPSSSRTRR